MGGLGRMRAGIVGALLLALALTACRGGGTATAEAASRQLPATGPTTLPAPPPGPCPWVGSAAPVETRVRWMLDRMTGGEKIAMVHGVEPGSGTGYLGAVAGVPRLCIPPLHLSDGPGGLGDLMPDVTQLPAPVALAATWDPQLAGRYGAVIGSEARGKGVNVLLGPTVNIVRDPRFGRAFETLGEDPYLTSQIGAGHIRGVQSAGVIAQVKHFAVYNQETFRNTPAANAKVDERTLREIYLPAFETAVRDAQVGSVMCAYSTVNDAHACASPHLLEDILKREWGFTGFVTSDWFPNIPGAVAADAGLDMQMPGSCLFGPALTDAVAAGRVATARLDDMVGRILGVMFRAGLVERPSTGTSKTRVATPSAAAVGRDVATQGAVLLRNEGVLPIDSGTVRSISVIGPGARRPITTGGGSASVAAARTVTPLTTITARADRRTRVVADDGSVPARAAMIAASTDVPIVFAGRLDSEYHDHTTLDLAATDTALINAVAAVNTRTVVVLTTGSAVVMPWLQRVAGVLEAWYPGQDAGHAIAALLFGDANPSGKLPVTFPASPGQVPAATTPQWPGNGAIRYSEGLLVGYRSYDALRIRPAFPFGFGLSYTTFAFDDLRITRPARDGRVVVSVNVRNTGARPGSEVVQVYVGQPPRTGEPVRQLRAFERVTLAPGQQKRVRLVVDSRAFSHWDDATRRWIAPSGRYEILVGDSSAHLPLRAGIDLHRAVVGSQAPAPRAFVDPSPAHSQLDRARCTADMSGARLVGDSSTPVTP
jgi:beta-glucosidase